jgi:hypothetical protein
MYTPDGTMTWADGLWWLEVGMHCGQPVEAVPMDYLEWIFVSRQPNFPQATV